MNVRWVKKKRMMIGTVTTVETAISIPQYEPYWLENIARPSETVYFASSLGHDISPLIPVKALPPVEATLHNPRVTNAVKTIEFPADMRSGCWLEFHSMSNCKPFGSQRELIAQVAPRGEVPGLAKGQNHVAFTCEATPSISPQARVTVMIHGKSLAI